MRSQVWGSWEPELLSPWAGVTPLGTRLCSSTWDLREPVLWDLGRGGFLIGHVVHHFLYFQPLWVHGCAHSPGTSESLSYRIWGEVSSWRRAPLFPPLPAPLGMWLCSPTWELREPHTMGSGGRFPCWRQSPLFPPLPAPLPSLENGAQSWKFQAFNSGPFLLTTSTYLEAQPKSPQQSRRQSYASGNH